MTATSDPAIPNLRLTGRMRQSHWLRAAPAAGLYGAILLAGGFLAYWLLFNGWELFDDEGFFGYSLKQFVGGHALYSSVYSEYGPFYYVFFGALFKVTGLAVTTESGRWVTLAFWLATALAFGLIAQRLTRSLWIGLVATVISYRLLSTFTYGAMHAQTLVAPLTALLYASVMPLRRSRRTASLTAGAALAALLLTKINVGGYACVAVAFSVVMVGPKWLRRPWLMLAAGACLVLLAPAITASEWHFRAQVIYGLSVACSALGLTILSWDRAAGGDRLALITKRLVAGFVACAAVTVLAIVLLGSGIGAFIYQTIITPTHQAHFKPSPPRLGSIYLVLGLVGLVSAGAARHWRSGLARRAAAHPLTSAAVRLSVALALLLPTAGLFPFKGQYPYLLAWPFIWAVALPLGGASAEIGRPTRVIVAALAISQTLTAYPVSAAPQIELGSFGIVLCGCISLADMVADIGRWSATRSGRVRAVPIGVALVSLLAGWAFYADIDEQMSMSHRFYAVGSVLHVIGGGDIHEWQPWARQINRTVHAVKEARCQTLMELPGLYSFNLWTGLATPSGLTGQQPYWLSLDRGDQARVLAAARASRRLCLIRDNYMVRFYSTTPLPTELPLVRYLTHAFTPIARHGQWTVEVRKRSYRRVERELAVRKSRPA